MQSPGKRWETTAYETRAAVAIEHIRSGKLRALAVTAATRSDVLPDIRTVSDFVLGL
jgi:tripartite-type tricarboxylate transporter receptor subunit TctC